VKEADLFKFKVPGSYNRGESPCYFPGSSKQSVREGVDSFNAGVPENPRVPKSQISPFFHPLNLKESEVEDLVSFLENSLRDPDLERYVPAQVLSNNCFPNNDPASRQELGCE
jgi:cytochrome c peroxidase